MATVTVSTRLEKEEAAILDELAKNQYLDRGALIKSVLRKGIRELRLKQAMEAYQAQEVTLSRAAEMSGVLQLDFLAEMEKSGIYLNYDASDLAQDLENLKVLD